eukprot:3240092-Amphidinium_carterae.1
MRWAACTIHPVISDRKRFSQTLLGRHRGGASSPSGQHRPNTRHVADERSCCSTAKLEEKKAVLVLRCSTTRWTIEEWWLYLSEKRALCWQAAEARENLNVESPQKQAATLLQLADTFYDDGTRAPNCIGLAPFASSTCGAPLFALQCSHSGKNLACAGTKVVAPKAAATHARL